MGMNFFVLDSSTKEVIVSPQLWIYFCVSLPLTAVTMLLWRWNTLRNLERKKACALGDEEQVIDDREDSDTSGAQYKKE